ncbi:MAG: ABC transporter substrate-binding protein [Bacteroidales bacterium]|nr:ABC transporter substrate-binding protein [Bacteroidales bacterium]
MRIHIITFIFLFLQFVSCSQQVKKEDNNNASEIVKLKYASLLKIMKGEDFYRVEILNPADTTKVMHSYLITDKNPKSNKNQNYDCSVVHVPIENAVVFTSLHSHLINELGEIEVISGVCDAEYILDEDIKARISNEKVKTLGSSMNPDIEKIMALNPDAIFLSPYDGFNSSGILSKLKETPIIECADYLEKSPLAQAEWIKFFGLLFNKLDVADSIFQVVETNYNSLKQKVDSVADKPRLFANLPINGNWYVPTKKSTAGVFYEDAGNHYVFDYLDGYGSKPLNFETVFTKANDADLWIIKYNNNQDYTLKSLISEDNKYLNFKAVKEKQVYGCNLNYSPYFDEIPFHPDLLLKDLIKISHPEVLEEEYQLRYFKKLLD